MQPGELADMVPPSMREDALQPLSWSQRLQARPDLMIPASLGGLLAVAGLGSICFGLMAGRSRLSSSTRA
jgi:hypothetical protein